ncbi:MAG: PAS domain S-box protein [Bacteroidales bacterium]
MGPVKNNQDSTRSALSFLSGTAIKFASSEIGDSIYRFIGESLKELNPEAIIIVNSLDDKQEISRTEAFFSPPGLIDSIISILGFNPIGKTYKVNSSILELKSGYIRKFEYGIHELSFGTIPKKISRTLEKIVNLGSIYGIAFMIDNRMYANAALIFRKGDDLSQREIIETFVRQASVTLKRLEAERNEEKFRNSEANVRAIMESTDDIIILLDKNGVVIDCNEAHAKRLNTTRNNLIGKNIFNLLPKEVGAIRYKNVSEAIKTGKPVYGEDSRGGFWNEYSIHPITSHKGKVDSVAVFSKDITRRRLAEKELKNNYTLLRIAGETAKFGGWTVDLEENIVTWSDVVAEIHEVEPGFSPTVEQGINYYAPEWRTEIAKVFRECSEKGTPYDLEMEIITSAGKRKWVRTNAEAVRNEAGKIVKVHGAFQDISEYKKISEALIAFERKFKSSIDNLLDAFGMYSSIRDNKNRILDFRIDYINPKGCELNNMSAGEQIGKGLCELLPAHKSTGLFDEYVKLVETGKIVEKESLVYEDSYAGRHLKRAFEIRASKFEDGFIATWRDITTKRQTEESLKESEREKASLIDNLPGFVYKCAHDHDWTMFYLSEKCFEVTGYKPEDMILNNKLAYNEIIHPDFREAIWKKWQNSLNPGSFFQEEYKIITNGGKVKWVWEQGRGVYSQNGELTHLEGFITDITYRKEMEEALRESEARLAELNATKDKFFSIIAHDLKSPFNSIIGIGELLSEQIRKKEYDSLEEYTSIMKDSSVKAMNLLTNLLEWSRSQTGRMEFNPEFIRLSQIVDEVIALSQYNASQKSIQIISHISKSTICFADKAMISSVVRNLVSNALKFTGKGGEIKLSARYENDHCVVTVSDNGIGMSQKEIENLFRLDSFYSTRGTENEGGTGLGLILCKEFISKHGGEIRAESVKGKGSIFLFTLPRNSR